MTPAPVGLRCPDHAGNVASPAPSSAGASRRRPRAGATDALVTKSLIAVNVAIYLVTAVQGNGVNAPGGTLFDKMRPLRPCRRRTATGGG